MAITREQAAQQLRKAIQLLINSLDEETALEVATVYPEWKVNTYYAKGQIITYGTNSVGDPQLYKVITGHTSQADWTPDTQAALFDAFGLDESGYPIWAQPAGAHDAYNIGDEVNYKGSIYRSLINGNVWAPDVYAAEWELVKESTEEPEEPDEPITEEYPDWVRPTGAHDAYNIGDIVKYNEKFYQSTINGNVWAPDEYPSGWTLYEAT